VVACLGLAIAANVALAEEEGPLPERVTFSSGDGLTTLVGYLFKAAVKEGVRLPAVVMMHGRAGAYSERARGVYQAETLSLRHKAWGWEWAQAGYIALLVDGFGPRGYSQGFPRFSYDSRPEALNEVTIRPLDAYGALAYLRTRNDVLAERVGLQGWSNGGSAAIATISVDAPGIQSPTPETGFRAALAFYPACGLKGHFQDKPFRLYAPTVIFHGSADEEVSYRLCAALVERSLAHGGDVAFYLYSGATHSFDSPSRKRQMMGANREASEDAVARSLDFFQRHLKPD
jgi:carboxymethylenebutenolidase